MVSGQSVLLLRGKWSRTEAGFWRFDSVPTGRSVAMMMSSRSSFKEVELNAKRRLLIQPQAKVELSYQWPQYMLMEDGKDAAPVIVQNDDDLDLFVEMRSEIVELNMCVTVLDEADGTDHKADMAIASDEWTMIALEELDYRNAKRAMDSSDEYSSDDDSYWHDFAHSETQAIVDRRNAEIGIRDKGKGVAYDSGVEADKEEEPFEEGGSSGQIFRGTTSRAVLDGVYEDEDEPPAMFGMDAPPVVDNVAEDGLEVFVGICSLTGLDDKFHLSTAMEVKRLNPDEFEVRDRKRELFDVNLGNKTCGCREFQMMKIPCVHALAAAATIEVDTDSLIGAVWSNENWSKASEGSFHLVPTPEKNDENCILPPIMRRAPGRPKKRRILSVGEFKRRGRKRSRTCTRCFGKGHNRATL